MTSTHQHDDITVPAYNIRGEISGDGVNHNEKAEIEHYDAEHTNGMKGDEVADAWEKGQVATGYETISIPQTIVKFKTACYSFYLPVALAMITVCRLCSRSP